MSSKIQHVVIVGGGAAGLATAIFAAEKIEHRRCRVYILDSASSLGAKILVAGGGRCNVTHEKVSERDYFANPNVVRGVLKHFTAEDTVKWFTTLGVTLKREDTGKLFPVTDQAHTVLQALTRRAHKLGIKILSDTPVKRIEEREGKLVVSHGKGKLEADVVVVATGGRSLPKSGSDGHGWTMVKRLGHTVTETYPALVPLMLEKEYFHKLVKGVSHPATVKVIVDDEVIDERTGSMLWTHFGLSGPVIMDASRHWTKAKGEGKEPKLVVNLIPGETFESLDARLMQIAKDSPKRSVLNVLSTPLPRSLVEVLLDQLGMTGKDQMHELQREVRHELVNLLIAHEFPVETDRGWNSAEVTAGGVPLAEINKGTMMSRVVENLYLVGEILDCDGRIGGFNFQWAWATGHIAGGAIAKYINETAE